jgi:pimeloyl-ACP methyl ester carboxylesterase
VEKITRHHGGHNVNGRQASPAVVLVHGLWFGAWSLRLLARRLRQAGFAPRRFRYRTTRGGIDAHAYALRQFIGCEGYPELHIVAHSLGGLVTLKMLADNADLPPGRVVLLGSPLRGSAIARKTNAIPGGNRLLGAARPQLESGYARLVAGRDIGMIAGSRSFGLGLLLGGLGEPGDGTVAIAETRVDGLRQHLVLPVTHTGMLFSKVVVQEAAHFLRMGSFSPSP